MEYTLEELIDMLDEVVRKAAPVPFTKKSMADAAQIEEIANEMRLVIPTEIRQAQNVVADKNRIISEAKKEAEEIIHKAEQKKKAMLDENAIMKEARARATEIIRSAQERSNTIRTSTFTFTDKMLAKVESTLIDDLNNLRLTRKTLNSGTNIQANPQQQAAPQNPPQQKK